MATLENATAFYSIVLRGTVLDAESILRGTHLSFLEPANGRITVGRVQIGYSFAANSSANVHFGFALGKLFLLKDPTQGILAQLANKVTPGSAVYIAGHSQGASMATLLRSYLEYDSDAPKDQNYSCKILCSTEAGQRRNNSSVSSSRPMTAVKPLAWSTWKRFSMVLARSATQARHREQLQLRTRRCCKKLSRRAACALDFDDQLAWGVPIRLRRQIVA
jgi:hypothetical protein